MEDKAGVSSKVAKSLEGHAEEVEAFSAKLEGQINKKVVRQLDLRIVRHGGEVELEHVGRHRRVTHLLGVLVEIGRRVVVPHRCAALW